MATEIKIRVDADYEGSAQEEAINNAMFRAVENIFYQFTAKIPTAQVSVAKAVTDQ